MTKNRLTKIYTRTGDEGLTSIGGMYGRHMWLLCNNWNDNGGKEMNKKLILAAGLIALMAFTTVITYKSLENLNELDLVDPFEVDFDGDE